MRFQAPQLGAMGVTFIVMRAFQFASLIAVIGLCANFINGITTAEHDPPAELIGTLTVLDRTICYEIKAAWGKQKTKQEAWNRAPAAVAAAPYFPPPPLAPTRDRSRARNQPPNPRIITTSPPRFSCDSDDSNHATEPTATNNNSPAPTPRAYAPHHRSTPANPHPSPSPSPPNQKTPTPNPTASLRSLSRGPPSTRRQPQRTARTLTGPPPAPPQTRPPAP
ncbi:hypothetical protein CHGG_09927 [Chaetomium globosum CBS 148.51]|uniref:Uncharacterized protein n=1 Tax=Chaetomium globosum (strain ATCC 6205 / CBS 148.51 / DSM 1962 / NBRC 6347 / NRRL 1970) TaxID=306901 RepID=Q2GQ27_CHAGB|nr:uncharacterized protein CHGG_09927 [Chaetomium globosum CBS 148.51]EAQ83523.1 hypothetical protein CHGG_09927 [Chaetomium globosum CBS 148.51]